MNMNMTSHDFVLGLACSAAIFYQKLLLSKNCFVLAISRQKEPTFLEKTVEVRIFHFTRDCFD